MARVKKKGKIISRPHLSEVKKSQIRKLNKIGLSNRKVAIKVSVSHGIVENVLKE